ncbi:MULTISPECIES: phage head closure protein [Methylosinus]|uniref:Head-tail adaptor protein n=1 Tax=Methylosinus trichosporium (strain ATCC 35070 / NCIMB 11131 / UNIQEM 75 / OB3b) TaxID=595536 RepID=A0A2D2CWK8_METT3|nr:MULTISPECIES: phage head closure protein [Methylosinus]ATQ67152.1 head-tail adaptor protein [Methylosinus trichosporium OB3b]OBS52698.1 head-tail adaptor protein [Methylosinus sp. 3S-1]
MSVTSIGALRQRVTLEAPIDTADDSGSMTRSYASVAQIWAKLTPAAGEARFVAEREEQAITVVALIRWRADVTSRMRLVVGARTLLIHSVYDPDGRRRFLLCRCEEIEM